MYNMITRFKDYVTMTRPISEFPLTGKGQKDGSPTAQEEEKASTLHRICMLLSKTHII